MTNETVSWLPDAKRPARPPVTADARTSSHYTARQETAGGQRRQAYRENID